MFNKGIILKATNETGQIIGSIRSYVESSTLYTDKLMVHPNKQNQGLGTQLLLTIEKHYPSVRYELFTSDKNTKTLNFYIKNGYREFNRKVITNDLILIFFEK